MGEVCKLPKLGSLQIPNFPPAVIQVFGGNLDFWFEAHGRHSGFGGFFQGGFKDCFGDVGEFLVAVRLHRANANLG